MKDSIDQLTEPLSPRELEVLRLISKGESRNDIAEKLKISKLTYDGYRKNIRAKLRIKNQVDWTKILYQLSTNQ